MNLTQSNYVIIPNEVFADKDNHRILTVEELYLYSWLYRHRIILDEGWGVKANIDYIHNYAYHFSIGNASRNKQKIKQMLISLYQKKYIDSLEIAIDKKLNYSDPIIIEFQEIDTLLGYNKISYETFDLFEDPLEFYIYAYIDCFGDKGRNLSYYKWSRLAKRSESTMQVTIEKMNSYDYKPRIWKFSGDYYEDYHGNVKQQENIYYTRPDKDVIKMWNGFYGKGKKEYDLAFGYKDGCKNNNQKSVEDVF